MPITSWLLTSIHRPSISLFGLRATCKAHARYLISFWFLPPESDTTQWFPLSLHSLPFEGWAGEVTVIITDRTKTALFPVWWARSQGSGALRGQAVNSDSYFYLFICLLELMYSTVLCYDSVTIYCSWTFKYYLNPLLSGDNVKKKQNRVGTKSRQHETHSDLLSDKCRSGLLLLI